jgi:hypothetical protein
MLETAPSGAVFLSGKSCLVRHSAAKSRRSDCSGERIGYNSENVKPERQAVNSGIVE